MTFVKMILAKRTHLKFTLYIPDVRLKQQSRTIFADSMPQNRVLVDRGKHCGDNDLGRSMGKRVIFGTASDRESEGLSAGRLVSVAGFHQSRPRGTKPRRLQP